MRAKIIKAFMGLFGVPSELRVCAVSLASSAARCEYAKIKWRNESPTWRFIGQLFGVVADATRTWVGVGEGEVVTGFDYVGIFREVVRGALEGVAGVHGGCYDAAGTLSTMSRQRTVVVVAEEEGSGRANGVIGAGDYKLKMEDGKL